MGVDLLQCKINEQSNMETNSFLSKAEEGSVKYCVNRVSSEKKSLSCLEKILVLCLFFALVAIITLAVLYSQKSFHSLSGPEICLTKECATVSAQVTANLDYSVQPCNDFYEFACGMWMKKHVIPQDKSNLYVYSLVRDDVKVTLKYLLEGDESNDLEPIQKARHLYQSCMNETLIETLNTSVVYPVFEEYGHWPVLSGRDGGDWNESAFSFTDLIVAARKYYLMPIIAIYVRTDDKNSSRRILHLDQPSMGMNSRDYYLLDDYDRHRVAYFQLAKEVAVLFGADQAVAEQDIKDILEFESKIANATMTNKERRDTKSLYTKMTIKEIKQRFPTENLPVKLDWLQLIQSIVHIGNSTIEVDDTEDVNVVAPSYVEQFIDILKNASKRTIANYVTWLTIKSRLEDMPKRFQEVYNAFKKEFLGTSSSEPRWWRCVAHVGQNFGMALGRLFVKETFDEDAKSKALDMIHDIREVFYDSLKELEWMDDDTKQYAIEKVLAIEENIGYPDFIFDDEDLTQYYSKITVDKDAYFGNILNSLEQYSIESLTNLRKPHVRDKFRWTANPITVNAYYQQILNQITFPAGMLQPPYYGKYQSRSMNYGSIGWLIGHEITHAFDDVGRTYDKDGNVREWWSDMALKTFRNRTKCIIEQYSAYVSPEAGMHLDGANTQGENIADNGGLRVSYKAYRRWVEKHGEELAFPGLNFTHNQLFFINYAQGWCGKMRKQYAINQVLTDPHSPGRFRVIGVLQNSPEFSEAFHCPLGTYMNPEKKCRVW